MNQLLVCLLLQVLPALERPPASCVWLDLCWEPPWRTPCWSSTPQTTGETPAFGQTVWAPARWRSFSSVHESLLLCLQGNRRGEEQDQDVCSAESHAAQRTTQDHHPGWSRQVSFIALTQELWVFHSNLKVLFSCILSCNDESNDRKWIVLPNIC